MKHTYVWNILNQLTQRDTCLVQKFGGLVRRLHRHETTERQRAGRVADGEVVVIVAELHTIQRFQNDEKVIFVFGVLARRADQSGGNILQFVQITVSVRAGLVDHTAQIVGRLCAQIDMLLVLGHENRKLRQALHLAVQFGFHQFVRAFGI